MKGKFADVDDFVTADLNHYQERRKQWSYYIRQSKLNVDKYRLPTLERVGRLEELQNLKFLDRLSTSNIDYHEYKYRSGDIVYCDIPYEQSNKSKYEYDTNFDHEEFYAWCRKQPHDIYFSSYYDEFSFNIVFIKHQIIMYHMTHRFTIPTVDISSTIIAK